MILTALLAITGPFLGNHGWLFFFAFIVGGPFVLDAIWTALTRPDGGTGEGSDR